jgi:tRNA(fMet)-specific endonuclease VapC
MDAALLDTDILSEIIKLKNIEVQRRALAYTKQYGQFAFSAITRYEVIRGYLDQGASSQILRFATFCQRSMILPINDAILDRTANLWVTARRGGHPKDDADLIIAATALEHGRTLVTGNTSHFNWIGGLRIEDWRQP